MQFSIFVLKIIVITGIDATFYRGIHSPHHKCQNVTTQRVQFRILKKISVPYRGICFAAVGGMRDSEDPMK